MASDIAVILGVIFTLGLLWLSYLSLQQNASAIRENRDAIEAQTVYQIQADGRELVSSLSSDPELFEVFFNQLPVQGVDSEVISRSNPFLTEVMQYYSSVHFQHDAGNFPEDLWQGFRAEFCRFLSIPIVKRFWNDRVVNGAYSDIFVESGNDCISEAERDR